MLKRFTVENFSSFQKENILDLTAGKTTVHSEHLVEFEKVKILKSAAIYGANASGKSNLVKSIDYAKQIILRDLNNVDTYKKYFRLDKDSLNQSTVFEFEFEFNRRFFSYGFSSILNTQKISEEWLYEIGKSLPEMIFERKSNDISLGELLIKNHDIKNRFEIYTDDMKNQSHQLFLSEIASKDLDIEEIQIINTIYNWFAEKLLILYPDTEFGGKSFISTDKNLSQTFRKYLNEFDTGIIDIESIEEDFEISLKEFPEKIKKEIAKDILKDLKEENQVSLIQGINGIFTIFKDTHDELKVQKLGLIHGKDIKEIFELKDESDGTKRLFDLIPLIGKFSQDYTIIIDEFDRSLHPKLTQKFFEVFYKFKNSKTQLIVTTHESNLIDLDLMRKDEIWFVEKDKNGRSKIFSLNQFQVRTDNEIEKAYLFGRYGAIPIFKTS
ncbi:MAG: AAA family ATPase [Candidatus Parabeggiatoa sp.]|nr:AAA family ATPase [Candidatus Parabeggiatoa sp.]